MNKKEFGERIRDIRNETKLSQLRFAEMVGVSAGQIGKIEAGNGNVTIETLNKIADALKMPLSELLSDKAYEPPAEDARLMTILALAKSLTPESQEQIIVVMKAFMKIQ